jgi:polar amino acid transport system substrate-binding protein
MNSRRLMASVLMPVANTLPRRCAAPRPALLQLSARLPGSRVLEDRFHIAFGAIAVLKGQMGRLSYISEFVEEAKATGLVQRAIERASVRRVHVAPPGKVGSQ